MGIQGYAFTTHRHPDAGQKMEQTWHCNVALICLQGSSRKNGTVRGPGRNVAHTKG